MQELKAEETNFIFAFHFREAAKPFLGSILPLVLRLLILYTAELRSEAPAYASLILTARHEASVGEQGVSLENLKLGPFYTVSSF